MKIKFTLLGCGYSMGVPRIDGYFGSCDPKEKKNYRTRCSAAISVSNKKRPELQDDIKLVLTWVISKADKISPYLVREIELIHPNAFGSLITETYKGYYSRPDIRKKLYLSEKPVHPFGYEVKSESDEFLKELTETVRARGTVYRDPRGGHR